MSNSDPHAKMREIQKMLATIDPAFMEFDPTDDDDAATMRICAALVIASKDGGSLVLAMEGGDSGRTEEITLQQISEDSSGKPVFATSFSSSDGTLSPEAADWAADLLADSHRAEVDRLIGE